MSFIITVSVQEGIVMATDSRTTYSQIVKSDEKNITNLAVGSSDHTDKLFVFENLKNNIKIGVSWHGQAHTGIMQIPVLINEFGYYFKNFEQKIEKPKDIPELFFEFIREKLGDISSRKLETGFHIAGYMSLEGKKLPFVYDIKMKNRKVTLLSQGDNPVISWNGEGDILSRLIQPVGVNQNGSFNELPFFPVHAQFFSLMDAVEFALFSVAITKKMMKFQQRATTVGGETEVLVLYPQGEHKWVRKKCLTSNIDGWS